MQGMCRQVTARGAMSDSWNVCSQQGRLHSPHRLPGAVLRGGACEGGRRGRQHSSSAQEGPQPAGRGGEGGAGAAPNQAGGAQAGQGYWQTEYRPSGPVKVRQFLDGEEVIVRTLCLRPILRPSWRQAACMQGHFRRAVARSQTAPALSFLAFLYEWSLRVAPMEAYCSPCSCLKSLHVTFVEVYFTKRGARKTGAAAAQAAEREGLTPLPQSPPGSSGGRQKKKGRKPWRGGGWKYKARRR